MSSDISKQKTKEQVTTVNTKIMKGNISLVKSTYSKDSDSSNYKENRKFYCDENSGFTVNNFHIYHKTVLIIFILLYSTTLPEQEMAAHARILAGKIP